MAVGTNDDESLSATVFIRYNFHATGKEVIETEPTATSQAAEAAAITTESHHHFNVVAELRVQISHSESPLASDTDATSNRETKSRVPLGIMKKRRRNQLFIPAPSVVFSTNQSHLACLIPVPSGYELVSNALPSSQIPRNQFVSSIVIFSIKTYSISSAQQTRQRNRMLPKLPDFVIDQTTTDDSKIEGNIEILKNDNTNFTMSSEYQPKTQMIHAAHVPKIVRILREDVSPDLEFQLPTLQNATCICNIPSDSKNGKGSEARSILLAGITNGSLMVIDFESARVKDTIYHGERDTDRMTPPIIHLSQCPPTLWKPLSIYGDELGSVSQGRISAVTRDGGICIFSTSFNSLNSVASRNRKFVNKSGLIMEVARIAKYCPMDQNSTSSLSALRYVCSKWINPMLLAVLTRSSFLESDFVGHQTSIAQDRIVVAQVWSVTEASEEENFDLPSPTSRVCVLSELNYPHENNLVELAHGTFSLSQEPDTALHFGRNYSIACNNRRGCLALSTQLVFRDRNGDESSHVKIRPACISWDWKRNAQGFTLVSDVALSSVNYQLSNAALPSIFSRFLISDGCAIHLYEKRYSQGKRLHKDIYNLSTLSPPHSLSSRNTRLDEVSPIMLSGDTITFPLVSRPLATQDISIRWEESQIPSSYVAVNGHCHIASIGKDKGHFIAVAASRGLCILDLSRTAWRASVSQDGNGSATPCVSGSFDNMSTTSQLPPPPPQWRMFNVNDEQTFRVQSFLWWETSSDDFILAVVQYLNDDAQYLVAWSPRRLGFGKSQLLMDQKKHTFTTDHDVNLISNHGLKLPIGATVDSMSILKDPNGSNRALLLLTKTSAVGKTSSNNYSMYQLQTKEQLCTTPEMILAKLSAFGNIPLTLSTDSITGIFLAGGSFLFDLFAYRLESNINDDFGIVGITSLCCDLSVACISHTGPILYNSISLGVKNTDSDRSPDTINCIISSYWMSGVSSSDRIVWNIAKNDGKVYCWAAPCCSSSLIRSRTTSSSPLENVSMMGEIQYLGLSSLWQNGSTLNGSDIALGPFLSAQFCCTLYAGQSSRKIRPKRDMGSILSFHVSNFVITAPHYTPSLYLSFLTLAKQDSHNRNESIEKRHIKMMLLKAGIIINGSSRSALRIIILKVVESLCDSKGKKDKVQQWNEGMNILSGIVSVTRDLLDELSFASFYLSVGRQLEPHQFDLLFPLPSEDARISVDDLFTVAVKRGSLSIALSGLSLFACHQDTQCRVVQLLCHCLSKIDKNFALPITFLAEEEKFLHQLYWFGVKLEDAIMLDRAQKDSTNLFDSRDLDENSIMSNSFSSLDESSISHGENSTESSDADKQEVSFISCYSQRRKSEGLVTKVVNRLFQTSQPLKHDSFEEDAIEEAAASFIYSGFEYDEQTITSTHEAQSHNPDCIGKNRFNATMTSVAGSICIFLSHAIGFNCKPSSKLEGWRIAAEIAFLIQGDRETLTISNAAVPNTLRISQLVSIDELTNACTFDHPRLVTVDHQAKSKVVSFLGLLTSHCCNQLHSKEAVGSILNIVLLLLLRHDVCDDVQLHRCELIMIGIVCGHISGRISDIIDMTLKDCDVYLIYEAFSQ